MSLLVVGSVALDSVETPFGKRNEVLGGSATYFSISASFFTKVKLVAVVGRDFSGNYVRVLKSRGIDTEGLEKSKGLTFRWKGKYSQDMNTAHTIYTKLNVFQDFKPVLPNNYQDCRSVFLANIDPELQLDVLRKVRNPRLVACDSMNLWINIKKPVLKKLLRKVDVFVINDSEARLFSGESNLKKAAKCILSCGPQRLVIKRGDSGALLLSKGQDAFFVPAFLLDRVKDPTGAGDSFAGGFMGHLSTVRKLNDAAFRKAVVYGTIMASFCVQDFGPAGLLRVKPGEIRNRFTEYRKFANLRA